MSAVSEDLAIIVSASTEQLGGDLRRAASMFADFAKAVGRDTPTISAKNNSLDFTAIKKSAHTAGVAAAREFGKSFKSIRDAVSLPSKAMISGGNGAALADPFILATAAADGLAAAVEVPFKLAAAGAHAIAAIVPLPFQLAGAAIDGLTGMVGGLIPVIGGVLSGAGKLAGTVVGGIGTVIGGLASGLGSTLGVIGSAVGQFIGGTAKVAIQGLAVTFSMLKESVNLAAEVEQTKISFDVLIGSATKATEVLQGLRKFAAETPFSQKDVTGSGKQLLGYGVAADQLVPSIKMLGDVSAATGKPLNELVYLYGTLINQDRAYIVDIKQFATAGIPIYQELAKVLHVTEDRTREMVEAGKVGIPEVQKAFVNMTSAGGRFAGLMEKQAQSFAGIREQLSDAWEIAKVRLGEAVIEELGLKDAAKDVTKFVENLHSKIDEIRPAIRFMGDLGRSVASAGMEFVKAAGQIVQINFQSIAASFPNVFGSVKKVIEDIGNFKLNPENIINAGFDIAEGLISGFGTVMTWMDQYYKKFDESFLKPMNSYIEEIKWAKNVTVDFFKTLGGMADAVVPGVANGDLKRGAERLGLAKPDRPKEETDFIGGGYLDRNRRYEMMQGGISTPAGIQAKQLFWPAISDALSHKERFEPRRQGESDVDFSKRYRELDAYMEMGNHLVNNLGYSKAKPELDQLADLRLKNFLLPHTDDPNKDFGAIHHQFWGDKVPAVKPGYAPGVVPEVREPSPLDPVKAAANDALAGIRGMRETTLAGVRGRMETEAASESMKKTVLSLQVAFTSVFGAASLAKDGLKAASDMAYKYAVGTAEFRETAKKAREEHGIDPMQKIANEYEHLQKALEIGNTSRELGIELQGGIDLGTYKRATGALGERAESLAGTHNLPDAALKDTTESVRLMNAWQSGNGTKTMEGLLQELVDLFKGTNKNTEKTADLLPNFAPIPQPLGQA